MLQEYSFHARKHKVELVLAIRALGDHIPLQKLYQIQMNWKKPKKNYSKAKVMSILSMSGVVKFRLKRGQRPWTRFKVELC